MAEKAETRFKNKVRADLASLKNTWFVKIQQQTIRGTPDFLLCVNGVFVAIELKTAKGKLDRLQEFNLDQIIKARGISIVATPKMWDGIFNQLIEISEGR
jgi:hypothetical protein